MGVGWSLRLLLAYALTHVVFVVVVVWCPTPAVAVERIVIGNSEVTDATDTISQQQQQQPQQQQQSQQQSQLNNVSSGGGGDLPDRLYDGQPWMYFGKFIPKWKTSNQVLLSPQFHDMVPFASTARKPETSPKLLPQCAVSVPARRSETDTTWKIEYQMQNYDDTADPPSDIEHYPITWLAFASGWYKFTGHDKTILVGTASVEVGGAATTVELKSTWHTDGALFKNPPIVFAQVQSTNLQQYWSAQVSSINETSFKISIVLSQLSATASETKKVSWLAMDAGEYTIPGGKLKASRGQHQAGRRTVDTESTLPPQCVGISVFSGINFLTDGTGAKLRTIMIVSEDEKSVTFEAGGLNESDNYVTETGTFQIASLLYESLSCTGVDGGDVLLDPSDAASAVPDEIEAEDSQTIIYMCVGVVGSILVITLLCWGICRKLSHDDGDGFGGHQEGKNPYQQPPGAMGGYQAGMHGGGGRGGAPYPGGRGAPGYPRAGGGGYGRGWG